MLMQYRWRCIQRSIQEIQRNPCATPMCHPYLTCALSRLTDYSCSLATWNPTNENIRNLFQRQAIPMVWDFAEANLVGGKITFANATEWVASALEAVP